MLDELRDPVLRRATVMEDHRRPFRKLIGRSNSWHKHRGTNFFFFLHGRADRSSFNVVDSVKNQAEETKKMSFDTGKISNPNEALFECNPI